jgi:hypothetical protein
LIEFRSKADRERALAFWPAGETPAPERVGERFLLVEDEKSVPFDRLRLVSSRDYRRPPEACVTVEPDGVTLALDPARSDLLVEAELSRFADPAASLPDQGAVAALRRFVVTAASLRRSATRGMAPPQVVEWFARRTGGAVPPAVRLLLAATAARVPSLRAARLIVLTLPSAELLDGLLQHPATAPLLGDRLGPVSVAIADDRLAIFERALSELGVDMEIE